MVLISNNDRNELIYIEVDAINWLNNLFLKMYEQLNGKNKNGIQKINP